MHEYVMIINGERRKSLGKNEAAAILESKIIKAYFNYPKVETFNEATNECVWSSDSPEKYGNCEDVLLTAYIPFLPDNEKDTYINFFIMQTNSTISATYEYSENDAYLDKTHPIIKDIVIRSPNDKDNINISASFNQEEIQALQAVLDRKIQKRMIADDLENEDELEL